MRRLDLSDGVRWAVDPLQLMQRIADQALAMIEHADGVLIGLSRNDDALFYVCGAGYLADFVGKELSLEGSLSGHTLRSRRILVTDDTEVDGRVNRDATRAFHVRSSVCVPMLRNGIEIGVLSVSSARPRAFDARDAELLGGLADFISSFVGAASDLEEILEHLFAEDQPATTRGDDRELAARFIANVVNPSVDADLGGRDRIEQIISDAEYSLMFQPIFALGTGDLYGVEALARFTGAGGDPPDVVIAAAHRVGLGIDLEMAMITTAAAFQALLPPRAMMMINAGPAAVATARLSGALIGADAENIVVELTEQIEVDNYPQLSGWLTRLRQIGTSLAIDDTGSGFSSLMHILELAPDIIKLDKQLTKDIERDPVRRSLASALVHFAGETGAKLVAEGIETPEALMTLRSLGVSHGQGFYLGTPAPIGDLRVAAQSGSARIRRQPSVPIMQ